MRFHTVNVAQIWATFFRKCVIFPIPSGRRSATRWDGCSPPASEQSWAHTLPFHLHSEWRNLIVGSRRAKPGENSGLPNGLHGAKQLKPMTPPAARRTDGHRPLAGPDKREGRQAEARNGVPAGREPRKPETNAGKNGWMPVRLLSGRSVPSTAAPCPLAGNSLACLPLAEEGPDDGQVNYPAKPLTARRLPDHQPPQCWSDVG